MGAPLINQKRVIAIRKSGTDGRTDRHQTVAIRFPLWIRDGTDASHFVTQRPSDPGIQQPGDPVDPVTLFYTVSLDPV